MAKKMLIDATHAEETRVVVVDGNKVEEFDFESENKRQLAGNIYLAKVTRVEPSLQAAFVDYGGNRHGFLAFSEIHPDYYQIPVADRQALMEEERAYAEAMKARDEEAEASRSKKRRRSSSASKAAKTTSKDAVESREVKVDTSAEASGMETIDLDGPEDTLEGLSPMVTVAETPVAETPVSEAPVAEATQGDDTVAAQDVDADPADATASDAGEAAPKEGAAETGETPEPAPVEAAAEVVADTAAAANTDEAADAPVAEAAPVADEDAAQDSAETEADDTAEDDSDEPTDKSDAAAKDSDIESVAEEDDEADIRPPRKPRPRRYKIQEVVKVRQILLVQVVKEERGNKGAALTTYLSLAGRYCVLMPNTARGGGISRKITNAPDRKKLKEIAAEIDVPQGAGLIIRTAGAKRTKSEIKRDYEYLQRLWEQIRELTLKSIAPAKIYEEGDLIKRSIRDLYSRDIDEVLVEGERGYRIAKDFMKMIMPSHAKNVKHYAESLPLFARYQVESYLGAMFNPTVQLKSGGYIVIGVTEALVAIDVNSGRATKEGSIEETALKTNLEAAEEVARQLRLRDLAGLIVIDFIDMDERKNNTAVEKRIKDKLKSDRARIQVGRISGFGLMEMSRQRLRPGMIEATTAPCPHCHGTGLIRSDDNLALQVLRQIEEEGTRRRCKELLVRCPVSIANYLMNAKREHIAQIEARYGVAVRVEGDPTLVSPDFNIEKLKTATRKVAEVAAPVVSADTTIMDMVDDPVEEDVPDEAEVETEVSEAVETTGEEETPKPKKRRRRRRRRKSKTGENGDQDQERSSESDDDDDDAPAGSDTDKAEPVVAATDAADVTPEATEEKPKPKRTRSTSSSRRKSSKAKSDDKVDDKVDAEAPAAAAVVAEAVAAETSVAVDTDTAETAPAEVAAVETSGDAAEVAPEAVPEATAVTAPADDSPVEPVAEAEAPAEQVTAEAEAEAEAEVAEPAATETSVEEAPEAESADAEAAPEPQVQEAVAAEPEVTAEPAPAKEAAEEPVAEEAAPAEAVAEEPVAVEPAAAETVVAEPVADVAEAPAETLVETAAPAEVEATPEPVLETASGEPEVEDPDKPKKRGWWSIGR
ncbi:Rne/Rng family ribonuclease [Marinovum sp. 2_MG-2023]|uniref:Rne/Rng family ribonuclease n=1 Tax=unclassified Marinovum TaxID=2647166 RepID=UPI0026E3DFF0|nr:MULTISPECIES: Rne/Rng family ribonuclease [unclassified Marinovum]MDO6731932.1 Rne/Rng family ribonuclease [Marinovum sp. 2_MG-2023]MDO6781184.1 Rne/Rng family ribonuclease [Marinovum sp. 1_MG-2023]